MTTAVEQAPAVPRASTGRPSWLAGMTLGRALTHLALDYLQMNMARMPN